jgi:type IV pilus assembly protein PilM
LEIDSCRVRLVQLHARDGGFTLTGAAASVIAPWDDDPERHRVHTVEAIRRGVSRGGIDSRLAVCGLRGPEVVVRGFEFPALPPEEIGGAVGLEAAQICPFSTQESTLDYQVTSRGDRKTYGYWVAATHGLIEKTKDLVHEAGLRCVLIDIDGLALLNLLGRRQEAGVVAGTGPLPPPACYAEPECPVLLDVGDSYATMAATDHAGRPFVRDIAGGGDQIIGRLATDTGMSADAIRTVLLVGEGKEQDTYLAGPIRDFTPEIPPPEIGPDRLERACAGLVEEVDTTLRYYAAQNGTGRPERLLVCGSFAAAGGFVELLAARLSIEVERWDPLADFEWRTAEGGRADSTGAARHYEGSAMAVAAGLAMRSI